MPGAGSPSLRYDEGKSRSFRAGRGSGRQTTYTYGTSGQSHLRRTTGRGDAGAEDNDLLYGTRRINRRQVTTAAGPNKTQDYDTVYKPHAHHRCQMGHATSYGL